MTSGIKVNLGRKNEFLDVTQFKLKWKYTQPLLPLVSCLSFQYFLHVFVTITKSYGGSGICPFDFKLLLQL